jgi:hypothetical protein
LIKTGPFTSVLKIAALNPDRQLPVTEEGRPGERATKYKISNP